MKVIVVGAGIGGLTTHLVCKRAGFEVDHYERQPRRRQTLRSPSPEQ